MIPEIIRMETGRSSRQAELKHVSEALTSHKSQAFRALETPN